MSCAALTPSRHTAARLSEIAGVMPVQWNQFASEKIDAQSIVPGWMVAMAEWARS